MLIDPGIDSVSFSITSTRPKRCSRLAMTLAGMRVVGREGHRVLCRAEAGVLRRRVVRRDGRAHDRRRDRDRDEGEDQELLAPLPPEEPPRPADDRRTPAGVPPTGRDALSAGWRCERRSSLTSGRGLEERVPRSGEPSGRQSDRRGGRRPGRPTRRGAASWVTTTAATPCLQASRIIFITASPFAESSAPEGSSASSRWRSPTTARAIATRWRSPPESSSG